MLSNNSFFRAKRDHDQSFLESISKALSLTGLFYFCLNLYDPYGSCYGILSLPDSGITNCTLIDQLCTTEAENPLYDNTITKVSILFTLAGAALYVGAKAKEYYDAKLAPHNVLRP